MLLHVCTMRMMLALVIGGGRKSMGENTGIAFTFVLFVLFVHCLEAEMRLGRLRIGLLICASV